MALTLLRHGEPEIAKGTCYGQSDVTTRPLARRIHRTGPKGLAGVA